MNRWPVGGWLFTGLLGLSVAIHAACPQDVFAQSSSPEVVCSHEGERCSSQPLTGFDRLVQFSAMNRIAGRSDSQDPKSQQGESSVETTGSIAGLVLDTSGSSVANAQVSLTDQSSSPQRSVVSGANGEFTFTRVPPGAYLLQIKAAGFEPFQSSEIQVTAQQVVQAPEIKLTIATARTELVIRPTEEIAAEQVKAEEKQRLIGIVPNFYTSYLFDAAPLTRKQKYSLSFRAVFDPMRFVASGLVAGIQQANNTYAGYGQGAAGYGKRFAADYGDGFFADLLSHAVFPALLHQDPRYFYQGSGGFKSRFVHAISFSVIARSDSGKPMPNYSFLLGDIGSGALANLYHPHADRGAGLVFTNAALGIAGRAGGSLIREFVSKHITTNANGNGKQP